MKGYWALCAYNSAELGTSEFRARVPGEAELQENHRIFIYSSMHRIIQSAIDEHGTT